MLSVNGISFTYNQIPTLKNISFSVKKGTHLSIMGESGCGKSTLLKALYGLLTLESGEIIYNNEALLGPEFHLVPGHPFMKYLTQDFDLMPYISAADNVGAFLSNFYPEIKKRRIAELLEVVGMTAYANTHVRYLSGGQQQRVALARVLAKEPEVLLLDEPFSQIDNFKKNKLRYRLFAYLKEQQITCITATHDKSDVLPFADQIMVMKDGEKVVVDTPKNLFQNPSNIYVGSLFSQLNVVDVNWFGLSEDKRVIIYPHELFLDATSSAFAEVTSCYYHGSYYVIELNFKGQVLWMQEHTALKIGSRIPVNCGKSILQQRTNILEG